MTDATDQHVGPDLGPACSACARPLRQGARFCAACGRRVEGSADRSGDDPDDRPADGGTSETITTATPDPGAPGGVAPLTGGDELRGPASGTGGSGVRRCPACRAGNVAERQLCGACGIDLDTGDARLTVAPAPAVGRTSGSVASTTDDGHAHPVQWWVPALAGITVLVVVAAAIVVLELGPFAPDIELPPADFVAASYPGAPEPLVLTDVATVTFQRPHDGRSFTPEHLVDGDPTTAWHGDEEALPADTNEKIDLFLDQPAWVAAVVIDNGDHRDADAYAATDRVQRAALVFDGDVRVPVTLLDQGLMPQIVELDEPLLSAGVRLEILETVAGTESEEVALTRIELLGHQAHGDDVELAEERAALLPAAGAITLVEDQGS